MFPRELPRRLRALAGCGLLIAAIVRAAPVAHAQEGSPFRYDDDFGRYAPASAPANFYDALKFTPLSSATNQYLSLGGDIRERFETVSNALLGARDTFVNGYDLSRILLFANLQYGGFRAFVQFGSHTEAGRYRGPVPTDVDRGDLQQGFLDYAAPLGPGTLTLRGGRFEMAFDDGAIIGLRDGPNVRQVWDGGWAFYALPAGRLDAFYVKPVDVSPGYFDDRGLPGEKLWGVHLQVAPALLKPFSFSAFYYGNVMPRVALFPRPERERTHTAGLRVLARQGEIDGSIGGIGQLGTYGSQDVAAWAAHADAGWTAPIPWTPRIGLRGDILSGGANSGGTIHTFNALYPNYAYSTEATIEAPSNLIQAGTVIQLHPCRAVTVSNTLEGLWRYSTRDAFYAAPLFPLTPPDGTDRRYSGLELQIETTWHMNAFTDLTGAYVHFDPGSFLRSAGRQSEDFGMAEVSLRF